MLALTACYLCLVGVNKDLTEIEQKIIALNVDFVQVIEICQILFNYYARLSVFEKSESAKA